MTEHKFGEWYPIEELEEKQKRVLFYIGLLRRPHTGFRRGDKFYRDECDRGFLFRAPVEFEEEFAPRFWMPLPKPPEEKE